MTPVRLGIVDYGMGNVRSVQKAVEAVGGRAELASDPEALSSFDGLILPGVGHFKDGMTELDQRGLREPLLRYAGGGDGAITLGRPLLGVCMGMQLLFESSTESNDAADGPPTPGLGLMPGQVIAFRPDREAASRVKVPHMGWNSLSFLQTDAGLLQGLPDGCHVYFVHGYHVPLDDRTREVATSICRNGQTFVATVQRGPLWAAQFHPEKSQAVGLRMLRNFMDMAETFKRDAGVR